MATAMTLINNVRTSTPVYAVNLATALDLTLHEDEAPPTNNPLPTYWTGTPGDFSGGGNMPAVTAATMDEAWAALKYERFLELLLEGRRLGDRWRWRTNSTPGDLNPLEYIPVELTTRYGVPADPLNLCYPMPRAENDANENIAVDFQDWISG